MAQVVEAKLRQSCALQHPVEHVAYTVRRDWPTSGRGKHILAALMPLHSFQHFHCVFGDGNTAVGVFRFQRYFPDFPIYPCRLPVHMDNTLLQINVTPFETQQLAPPETGGQVKIIQFIYAALFGLLQESTELLSRERVHSLLFNLWQSAAVSWFAELLFMVCVKKCRIKGN